MLWVAPSSSARRYLCKQIGWYLGLRLLFVTLFLSGTIFFQWRAGSSIAPTVLYYLLGFSFFQAFVSGIILLQIKNLKKFMQGQIAADLLFSFCLIVFSGGTESPFSFLYILVILAASVFLPRREILVVAAAASIFLGSFFDLQYYGYLLSVGDLTFSRPSDGRVVFYTVFVNVIAFFLTAVLSGILVERLRRTEQELATKRLDLEEMDNLNRAIAANIGSGLMVLNQQGRIRSFNHAAEKLTGFSLSEVYDRKVVEILPGMKIYDNDFLIVPRGEVSFVGPSGEKRIFGFASSLVCGARTPSAGLLVNFQDLTQIKEMEDRLKRADRLAAVGKLASGMAHEIRNPLASISGSVQLLMEERYIHEDDRRLMAIVVKEAERLSLLLSEFLTFARPPSPQCKWTDTSSLLDDVILLSRCDQRFAGRIVEKAYPLRVLFDLDEEQIRQVVWNLLLNAVEAVAEGGSIRLGIEEKCSTIFVEDSGPGIPEEIRNRIFDPFFTTKERGTGLGLATAHAIVTAHGGELAVTSAPIGGARFEVRLPPPKGSGANTSHD